MAKVNYQYEKRQKELAKKRKKEQKEKLKQIKKNSNPSVTEIAQETLAVDETSAAEEAPAIQIPAN